MKTAILSVKQVHQHRRWCQLAHLQSRGWPVRDWERVRVFNGLYIGDFEDEADDSGGNHPLCREAVARGFPDWAHMEIKQTSLHSRIVRLNLFLILRDVVIKSGEPWLVIEDDAFFRTFTYTELCERWEQLKQQVGEENINVAMLFFYGSPTRYRNPKCAPIDDFWARGSQEAGQVANIYTPTGAKHILDNCSTTANIERYLLDNPDMPGLFTSQVSQAFQDGFWNFDSIAFPMIQRRKDGSKHLSLDWFNHLEGSDL